LIARDERSIIPGKDGGSSMSVTVRPVTSAVGAEISGVDLRHLNEPDFAVIEGAWYTHSMILLRGQTLGDDDLLSFSRRFGELDPPPNQERGRISPPGYPDIYVVSNVLDAKGNPIGALGDGEAVWHTDMSYLDTPPDASMLYSLEIPSIGGNTWFTSMQAACDAPTIRWRRRAPGIPRSCGTRSTAAPCSISAGDATPTSRAIHGRSPTPCSKRCGHTSPSHASSTSMSGSWATS
jgi:hypothetical protein